jgi:methylated-DNA-[protein]-cysteine S-methyltransferase
MEWAPVKTTRHQERIYNYLIENVPKGRVTSYGAIAKAMNSSPRAVGQALRANPYAPKVPCHRVVAANGELCGFNGKTTRFTLMKKKKLLKSEGIPFENERISKKYFVS